MAERILRVTGTTMGDLRSKRILQACAAVGVLVALVAGFIVLRPSAPSAFNAIDVTGAGWGKDFALTDHTGRARTLADFRGKAVALFFGFINCPDVCPTTMSTLAQAMKLLGDDAKRLQVVFVTVDPKRDTPQILAEYVPSFHPSFLGMYGDPEKTAQTAKEFRIYYQAQSPNAQGSYGVDHSGQVLVFDAQGRLRLLVKPDLPPEAIAQDVRLVLTQAGP